VLELPLVPYKSIDRLRREDPKGEVSPAYLVAPLQKPFSTADVGKASPMFEGMLETIRTRYIQRFPHVDIPWKTDVNGYAALRYLCTAERDLLFPLDPDFLFREGRRQLETVDDAPPVDEALRAPLRDAAFSAIDAANVTHDDEAVEAGLVKLDSYAFRLLDRGRRAEYLKFLIKRLGVEAKEEIDTTIFELFKAVEDRAEIDSIVTTLGQSKINDLFVVMESNVWGLLTLLGEKLSKDPSIGEPKFDIDFVASFLFTILFDKASPTKLDDDN
jgi:hypothetical protein